MIKERSAQHSTDVLVDEKGKRKSTYQRLWILLAIIVIRGGYSCIMCGFLMTNVKVAINSEKNRP